MEARITKAPSTFVAASPMASNPDVIIEMYFRLASEPFKRDIGLYSDPVQ